MRIARRVRRVESAARDRQRMRALAGWIADRYGVTVGEVLEEARSLRDEAWRQGAAPEVILARECGQTVATVREEAARVLAEAEAVGL
jgi:hypothetical protein